MRHGIRHIAVTSGLLLACFYSIAIVRTAAEEIRGTIEAVDEKARTVTFRMVTNGKEKVSELEVSRIATIVSDGKSGGLDTLKPGQKASLEIAPDLDVVTKITAGRDIAPSAPGGGIREIHGTIAKVDIQAHRLTIKAGKVGTEELSEFQVSRLVSVTDGGKTSGLGLLKAGQNVTIAYNSQLEAITQIDAEGAVRRRDRVGEIAAFKGHSNFVHSVAFRPDGAFLASAGDSTVRLWNLAEESKEGAPLILSSDDPGERDFLALAFSPDGKMIAASKNDGSVVLWDATTPTPKLRQVLRQHTDPVAALAFRSDSKVLATAGRTKGLVVFWDLTKPTVAEWTTIPPERNGVTSMAFSPDRRTLAQGVTIPGPDRSVTGEIWVWDVGRKPFTKRSVFRGIRTIPRSVTYSPDGKWLAYGDGDVVKVCDSQSGKALGTFEKHFRDVASVAFSPDGKSILSGGHDETVRLWNASTMEQIQLFEGPTNFVDAVAFSPDGRLGASGGYDRVVRLWKLPDAPAPKPGP